MKEQIFYARSRDPAPPPDEAKQNAYFNTMKNQKNSNSKFINKISKLMETKYDFKRLKLWSAMITVFFAVMLIGIPKLQAQVTGVTIGGSANVCLDTPNQTYTATLQGSIPPNGNFTQYRVQYSWDVTPAYGTEVGSHTNSNYEVEWTTCTPTATDANVDVWVYYQTRTRTGPHSSWGPWNLINSFQAVFNVNISQPLPTSGPAVVHYDIGTAPTAMSTTGYLPVAPTCPGTYAWTASDGSIGFSSTTAWDPDVTGLDGLPVGSYWVQMSATNSCGNETYRIDIEIEALPVIAGAPAVCLGTAGFVTSAYTATPPGLVGDYTYQWRVNETYSSKSTVAGTPNEVSVTFTACTGEELPRDKTNWAYVEVTMTEIAPPHTQYTEILFVDVFEELPAPATTPEVYVACENDTEKDIEVFEFCGVQNGLVDVLWVDASGDLTFADATNWETKINNVSTLLPGDYPFTLTLTSYCLPPQTYNYVLTVNPEPELSIITNSPVCYNEEVVFTLDGIVSGTGPFDVTYNIDGGTNVTKTGLEVGDELFREIMAPGGYTLAITEVVDQTTGCKSTIMFSWSITVNPEPNLFFTINGTDINPADSPYEYCFNTTIDILLDHSTSGTGPFFIKWDVFVGTSTTADPTLSNQVGTNYIPTDALFNGVLDPGKYRIEITEITDANSCSISDQNLEDYYWFEIGIREKLVVAFELDNAEVCYDEKVKLTLDSHNGAEPIEYDINVENSGGTVVYTANVTNGTAASVVFDQIFPADSYTIKITNIKDAFPCVADDVTLSFIVNPEPNLWFQMVDNNGTHAIPTGEEFTYCCNEPFKVELAAAPAPIGTPPFTIKYTINAGTEITKSGVSLTNSVVFEGEFLADTYEIQVTSIVDDKDCEIADVSGYNFKIIVDPVEFELDVPAEVCHNSDVDFEILNDACFGTSYTVTWTFFDGTDEIASIDVNNSLDFNFEPAAPVYDIDEQTTTIVTVQAVVKNQYDCESDPVTKQIKVISIPLVTQNNIVIAVDAGDIYVSCTKPATDLLLRGEDDVQWTEMDGEHEHLIPSYDWERSLDNGATWNSVGHFLAQYDISNLISVDTWFRRKVTLNDPCNGTPPHYSNVIKVLFIDNDHWEFDVTATADVCVDDPNGIDIDLDATVLATYPNLPDYTEKGEWSYTGPGTLTFTDLIGAFPNNITADEPGKYMLTYTITPEFYVHNCTGPFEMSVEVIFEEITVDFADATNSFGLPNAICLNANPQVLVLPDVTVVPSDLIWTGVFTGNGIAYDAVEDEWTFDPSVATVGTHTITYTATTAVAGCTDYVEFDIEVYALPTVTFELNGDPLIANNPYEFCYDTETILEANSNATPDYIITYEIDGLTKTATSSTDIFDVFAQTFDPGTYVIELLTIEDGNGCIADINIEFSIKIRPELEVEYALVPVEPITGYCYDQVIGLEFVSTNGDEDVYVNWEVVNAAGDIVESGGNEFPTGALLFDRTFAPGSYTITLSDIVDDFGCEYDGVIEIEFTVNPEPVVTFTNPVHVCEFDASIVTLASLNPGTFDLTVNYTINGVAAAPVVFNAIGEELFNEVLDPAVYNVVFTSIVDGNGCAVADPSALNFSFEVHALPTFTVAGDEEVCHNSSTTFVVGDEASFGATYKVTWTIDGAEFETPVVKEFTDINDFEFIPEDYEIDVLVTQNITITAVVTSEWGCVSEPVVSTIKVISIPEFTKNEILDPEYNGEVKTVWCTDIPAGLIIYGEDDVNWTEMLGEHNGLTPYFQWQRSTDEGVNWNDIGAPDVQRDYTMPKLTQTTWYRRAAMLDVCGITVTHYSNEVHMIIIDADHFVFELDPVDDVCYTGLEVKSVEVSVKDLLALPAYVAGGVWSGEGLTFADPEALTTTATVTEPGTYTATYTMTEESYVQSCGGPTHSASVEFTFEFLEVEESDFGLEAAYCVDADAVELIVPEFSTIPELEVTYRFHGGAFVVEDEGTFYFDPAIAGVGEFTIYFEAKTATCTVTTEVEVEVEALPDAPIANDVEVCYDGEVKTATATVGENETLIYYEFTYEGEELVLGDETDAPSAILPGVYQAMAVAVSELGCVSAPTLVTLTIQHTPEATLASIENTFFDENVTITATHASVTDPEYVANAIYTLEVVGEEGGYNFTSDPVASFSHTFNTAVLGIGEAKVNIVVTYVYGDLECASNPEDEAANGSFYVLPPYYAMFGPSYVTPRNGGPGPGYVIPGAYQEVYNGHLTVMNVPINSPLSIAFRGDVRTANNEPLPLKDQGEFTRIERWNGSAWVNVPLSSEIEGGKQIFVDPLEGLQYGTHYRMAYQDVYEPGRNEELPFEPGVAIRFTLDAQEQLSHGNFAWENYEFDDLDASAYEGTDNPFYAFVYFKTISECNATIPTVFPAGEDASICEANDEIHVEFVNPVRYLTGTHIGSNDSPHHKFKVQKMIDGVWTDIAFTAHANDIVTVNGESGPTNISLKLGEQMDYCTEYRVVMNKHIPAGGVPAVYEYGFIDLVTGCNVLGVAHITDGEGGDDYIEVQDWNWKTTCEYDLFVDVAPWPVEEFGERPDNVNNVTFSNEFPNLVTYPYDDETEEYGLEIQTDPYSVANPGASFTMSAVEGEGYHFLNWSRRLTAGGSFTTLATTGPEGKVEGIDYFPQSFTWRPAELQENCGQELTYRANFAKNTYKIDVFAYNNTGADKKPERGTVTGAGTYEHGKKVTLTATPADGFYFVGWDYSALPASVQATVVVEDYPDYFDIVNPALHTAEMSFELLGDLTHNSTWEVKAKFGIFIPRVWAAAQATDYFGNVVNNVTEIEFTTLYVSNILETGLEGVEVFEEDNNFYEWADFRYGNPDYSNVFANVRVMPLDVPCEYGFKYWERWDPIEEEWNVVSTDPNAIFAFIPVEHYRLRAQFEWRTDVAISVTNDVVVVPDPLAEASILVQQGEDSWFNSTEAHNFAPGEVLTITVIPEPDYFTYGFVDPEGNQINTFDPENPSAGGIVQNEEYPKRVAGAGSVEDRTVWQYVVGCDAVDLKAVVGKKRFLADAKPSPVAGGDVLASNPIALEAPADEYGYGFWPEDAPTGFVENEAGRSVKGFFEIYSNVNFVATPDEGDATHIWEFEGWYDGVLRVSTNPVYNVNVVEPISLVARFINTYQAPTWEVTIAANPEEAMLEYYGDGAYEFEEEVEVGVLAAAGWEFVEWTTDDIELEDEEANPAFFDMPKKDVHLVAQFQKKEVDVNLVTRTYLRTAEYPNFPYTDGDPYIVAELEEPATGVHGGLVTVDNEGPYVFGDVINVTVKPYAGFRFINSMVGEEIGLYAFGDNTFPGEQVNPKDGYTTFPNEYTFAYTVPALYGEEMDLQLIFGEATGGGTIVYPYPAYELVTSVSPAGYGVTFGDGHYAHSVQAQITEEAIEPGYEFNHWTVRRAGVERNGLLVNGQTSSFNYVDMLGSAPEQVFEATAHYTAINYAVGIFVNPFGYGRVNLDGGVMVNSIETSYTIEDDVFYIGTQPITHDDCHGYEFVGWSYDIEGALPVVYANSDPVFGFIPVIPEGYMSDRAAYDVTIYAQFERVEVDFILTLETALDDYTNVTDAVGTIQSSVEGPYPCTGSPYEMVISTVAKDGYSFKHYTDGEGTVIVTIPQFNYSLYEDAHFIAVYEAIPYNVLAIAGEGGSVEPEEQIKTIGQAVEVLAEADTGYEFVGWEAEGVVLADATANPAAFDMPTNDVTLHATFALIDYNLTATAEEGGSVDPEAQIANYGEQVTVEATADAGYEFVGWTTEGVELEDAEDNPAVFSMPANDVALVASFELIDYTVTATANPENGGELTDLEEVYHIGDEVSITATANPGFVFVDWTVAGVEVEDVTSTTLEFEMPAGDVTLVANFEAVDNSIAGKVRYFNKYESDIPASANIKLALYEGEELVATTGLTNGAYAFTDVITPGTEYTLKLWEDKAVGESWSWNNWGGVNATDALIISYMGSHNDALLNFPWIAPEEAGEQTDFALATADVNGSGSANGIDALLAMRRSIGMIDAFAVPNFQVAGGDVNYPEAPTTVFAPHGTYAAATPAGEFYYTATIDGEAGFTNFNIYFIASADVNASYVPQGGARAAIALNYDDVKNVSVGEEVAIPVRIDQASQLGAMSIGLHFNNELLAVTSVEGFDLAAIDNTNGTINLAWFDVQGTSYAAEDVVFTVYAKVLAPVTSSTEYFMLDGNTEFADTYANVVDVTLTTVALDSGMTSVDEFDELNAVAYPNPFNDETTIAYTLPESGKVNLVIYNQIGQEVVTLVNEVKEAGQHTARLSSSTLSGSGTYYYRVVFEGGAKIHTVNGTLILVK